MTLLALVASLALGADTPTPVVDANSGYAADQAANISSRLAELHAAGTPRAFATVDLIPVVIVGTPQTNTYSPTSTPTFTATPTVTQTQTRTDSGTNTASFSNTATPTNTATRSATATPTNTATVSPTFTILPVLANQGTPAPSAAAWPVADVGTRAVVGEYRAATTLITGAASSQNLASLENPAASGKTIYVKRVIVNGAVQAASGTVFLYRIGLTTAVPTGGTTLTSQKHATTDATAVGIVRQGPTATGATGDMWVGSPGVILPSGVLGAPAPFPVALTDPYFSMNEKNDVVLAAGEAILVRANTNTTDWRHWVLFFWQEA